MIGRLPRIAGAYLVASIAAGFALGLGLLLAAFTGTVAERGWQAAGVPPPGSLLFLLVALGCWSSLFVSIFALVPALAVIAVAERLCLRSVAFYGATGAAVAVAVWAVVVREGGPFPLKGFELSLAPELLPFAAIAGLVGGVVYWGVAGCGAGD